MSSGTADNITFILVRPQYLGNIGSTARAMKNFGLKNLSLVEPPKNYKDAEARKMSVGAFDLLKNARVFESLEEAIKDQSLVIGTASGQQRAAPLVSLKTLRGRIEDVGSNGHGIAVIFGDEVNGLPNKELDLCHHLVSIETNPEFSSLNLAQAVCLFAYELSAFRREAGLQPTLKVDTAMSTVAEENELFEALARLTEQAEFTRPYNKDLVIQELRRFYFRAHPTKRETDLLKGLLHKLLQSTQKREDSPSKD